MHLSIRRRNWSCKETMMAFALYRILAPRECDDKWLYSFEGRQIDLLVINQPSHEFLEYYHRHAFLGNAA